MIATTTGATRRRRSAASTNRPAGAARPGRGRQADVDEHRDGEDATGREDGRGAEQHAGHDDDGRRTTHTAASVRSRRVTTSGDVRPRSERCSGPTTTTAVGANARQRPAGREHDADQRHASQSDVAGLAGPPAQGEPAARRRGSARAGRPAASAGRPGRGPAPRPRRRPTSPGHRPRSAPRHRHPSSPSTAAGGSRARSAGSGGPPPGRPSPARRPAGRRPVRPPTAARPGRRPPTPGGPGSERRELVLVRSATVGTSTSRMTPSAAR